jgi:hypothetical protein
MKPRLVLRNEAEQRRGFYFFAHFQKSTFKNKEDTIWHLSLRLLRFCRLSLSLSVLVLPCGVVNLMEGYGNDNPGANAHVR